MKINKINLANANHLLQYLGYHKCFLLCKSAYFITFK